MKRSNINFGENVNKLSGMDLRVGERNDEFPQLKKKVIFNIDLLIGKNPELHLMGLYALLEQI